MAASLNQRWINLKSIVRRWIDIALGHTHDHYFCNLPGRIGLVSSLILRLFFSGVKISRDQTDALKKIQNQGIFILATQYKSYFEFLFYHSRYQQMRLPFPEIGLDHRVVVWQPVSRICRVLLAKVDYLLSNLTFPDPFRSGYIGRELLEGRCALLSLVDKKSFYQQFVKAKNDPILYLMEIQKTIDRPIYIVPHIMFFGKKPQRSTPEIFESVREGKGPGVIKRIFAVLRRPGKVFVEISEPVNLKQFLAHPVNRDRSVEQLAHELRRRLLDQIHRHRQSITGPVRKTIQELKQNVLTTERLRIFMDQYAKKQNIPLRKIHKEADACLEEIAAKYNGRVIKVAATVVGWIINMMYEGVDFSRQELNRLKHLSQRGPVVLVPCHKSHVDYLIMSLTLYRNNMSCPHVAAGHNLAFWPMGPIFRAGGAFFVRRSFKKDSVLYSKVFSEYIEHLVKESVSIEIFIEGGRSRTGKLISPKLGGLSLLLQAFRNGACEDMIVAPIYIGYDQILEENAYVTEIEGGQKKPESFLEIIRARKFLKKRYGKIYIRIDEPISIKEMVARQQTPITEMSSKEFNTLCRYLGHRIISAINRVTIVTPHALVACALLGCSKSNFTYDHVKFNLDTLLAHLKLQGSQLAGTLHPDPHPVFQQVFDSYLQRKIVGPISQEGPSSQTYWVESNKRPILEYYKNNCIAFFIPAAFTSLAILNTNTFQFASSDLLDGFVFLQEFFKNEFILDVDKAPGHFVRKNIKAFIDDEILIPHATQPDTYNLTSTGLKKLKLFSGLLEPYLESYWITLNFFMRFSEKSIAKKDRLKKVHARGVRMYKRKEIELKEALSNVNYENALDYFTSHGIRSAEDHDKIERYKEAIENHLSHLRQ